VLELPRSPMPGPHRSLSKPVVRRRHGERRKNVPNRRRQLAPRSRRPAVTTDFLTLRVPDDGGGRCAKPSSVLQGPVGAFCASTGTSASTGPAASTASGADQPFFCRPSIVRRNDRTRRRCRYCARDLVTRIVILAEWQRGGLSKLILT
jgi:hypothetical protein